MNDPKRVEDLERRVSKLEDEHKDIVESEKLLLRLARYHRAALQGLDAKIDIEMGDVRERFDKVEQGLGKHDSRFDAIDQKLSAHTEVLTQLVSLSESYGKRFDKLEAAQASTNDLLQQILARLPKQE